METNSELEAGRILVITAHPDDAEGGVGGAAARWAAEGREVYFLTCTDGGKGTKDPALSPFALAELREEEQAQAARILGVKQVVHLRRPDGELVADRALTNTFSLLIRHFRPGVIVVHDPWRTPWQHPDHRAAGQAAFDGMMTARDLHFAPEQAVVGFSPHHVNTMLLTFPNEPDFFIDIEETIELKIKALGCHTSQIRRPEMLRERVIERAQEHGRRGGFTYAEGFRRVDFH